MKPRTKIQKAVDYLQCKLTTVTEKQKQYAFENIFTKYCYRTKNKAFCLECGDDIDVTLIGRKKTIVCPHCNSKLKIKNTRCRTYNTEGRFFGIAETIKYDIYDFQVVRAFELCKYHKKGEKTRYWFREVCQNWYTSDDKRIIYAGLEHPYSFSASLEIRHESYWKHYNPIIAAYCPTSKFMDKYTKLGISSKMTYLTLATAYKEVRYLPQAETLLKANYCSIIRTFSNSEIREYWQALKICIRHKYKIEEADIYRDYLQLVKELGKDLSNPIIVCPKNLHKEHNKILKIVQRKREKEQAKRSRERALKQAIEDAAALKKFQEEKEKFFNLEIKGKGITIVPLKSIEDFIKEAETHKHCVLTNKYYKKEDSLILKAEINNQSIETIEFDLKKMKVVQSRGLHNQASKHHDDIINLLNTNKYKIEKIHHQL